MGERKFESAFRGREVQKVLELIRETQGERGDRSERIALRALEHLKESGFLEEVLAIPRRTKIDRMGIDIICKKTAGGYYFINIKSSFRGVEHHIERKNILELKGKPVYEIYPIAINLLESPQDLEKRLQDIFSSAPSSDVLPTEIKSCLDALPNELIAKEQKKMGKKKIELTAQEIDSIHEITRGHFTVTAEEKIRQLQDKKFVNQFKIITNAFKVGKRDETKTIWETKISLLFSGKFLKYAAESPNRNEAEDNACRRVIAGIERIVSGIKKI